MYNLHKIARIYYVAVLAIIIAAAALSLAVSSAQAAAAQAAPGQAARGPDFPAGLRIHKARFPGYGKWSRAMVRGQTHAQGGESGCARQLGKPCRLDRWARFLDTLRQAGPERQITSINEFINANTFISDRDNWGIKDYWSAPGEFFANGGDCEDYVIAKYLSLRRLGFRADDLRLVVLVDRNRRLAHAVLVVELDGRALVLDNLEDRVRPWSELPHYRPLYSLNEQAVWLHVTLRETAQLAKAQNRR
ncbi:MAG: transglutaminase-like cysteine peptidase [Kiloniellales bacterium]